MKETREDIEQELARRKARLHDIEQHGAAVMSKYDVEIAHQGNADQAVATAKMLLTNQIAYLTRQLKDMPATQKALF